MANRTDKEAYAIHGTNPQNLVEYIVRQKVYATTYWKESCFALTAESLIEKAVDLKAAGGTHGGARKPSDFLCLILKMLQIQPDKEVVIEYIKNEDFKYVRLLGAFYMRLVGRPLEVYQYLEPLYNDYRKIRLINADGNFVLSHVDEVVWDMLNKDYMFDIALPRLPARLALERQGALDPRVSVLDEEFDEAAVAAEAAEAAAAQAEAAAAFRGLATGGGDDADKRGDADRGGGAREADDQRRHSPERGKREREKWQLTRDERREQAARRRSRSRSRSRSGERGRDRRDGGRDRGRDAYERDRHRNGRDHGGRRSRSRSRSRDRDRTHGRDRDRRRSRSRSRTPERQRDRDADRDRGRDRGVSVRDVDKGRGTSKRQPAEADAEIAEANALRASLGLKPLK